jgi:hypothetical protein
MDEMTARQEKSQSEKHKGKHSGLLMALFIILVILAGVGAAYLICLINRVSFGIFVWPVAASVAVFLFSTVGFFSTEEKSEIMYGACSIAAVACFIVQLGMLF